MFPWSVGVVVRSRRRFGQWVMFGRLRDTVMGRPAPTKVEASPVKAASPMPLAPMGEEVPRTRSTVSHGRQPRRPRRIILVRHGQSVGNVDAQVYADTPDWKVGLTAKGREQSQAAGRGFRALLDSDPSPGPVFIYSSPYKRCKETVDNLLAGADIGEDRIAGRREEPRIREQDFGNFQDPQKMKECKVCRDEFGRFFYRFPNGESGADVYDRVSTFFESLYREMEFGLITPETSLLLVTHGLTARLILMRWYHWSVESFEATYNPGNAQLMVMDRQLDESGGLYYSLSAETIRTIRLPEEAQAAEKSERQRQLLITKNMSGREVSSNSKVAPETDRDDPPDDAGVEVLEI